MQARTDFYVNSKDIVDGATNDCRNCPVARSAIRKIEKVTKRSCDRYEIAVNPKQLIIYTDPTDFHKEHRARKRLVIELPKRVTRFIRSFDAYGYSTFLRTMEDRVHYENDSHEHYRRYRLEMSELQPFSFSIYNNELASFLRVRVNG